MAATDARVVQGDIGLGRPADEGERLTEVVPRGPAAVRPGHFNLERSGQTDGLVEVVEKGVTHRAYVGGRDGARGGPA